MLWPQPSSRARLSANVVTDAVIGERIRVFNLVFLPGPGLAETEEGDKGLGEGVLFQGLVFFIAGGVHGLAGGSAGGGAFSLEVLDPRFVDAAFTLSNLQNSKNYPGTEYFDCG